MRALGVTRRIKPTAGDAMTEWFDPHRNHRSVT
jgi:hypothetical protein